MNSLALDELALPVLAHLGQVDGAVGKKEDVAVVLRPHLLHALQVLKGDGNDAVNVTLAESSTTVVVVVQQLAIRSGGGKARAVGACVGYR